MSSILAFLVLAAAEAHEETSKTLFYVVGGLAALYGVIIGVVGVVKHDFPGSRATARGVFALSAVVVVAAMASSVLTG